MSKQLKAHLAVLAANFIFGANFAVMKFLTPSVIKPLGLNVVRIVVSTIIFWLLFAMKPSQAKFDKKYIGRFIICGITGVALNQILFVKGLSLTTSIHASLLMLGTPIIIIFIAAWLLGEKLNTLKFLGLALGIGGAINLILQKENTQTASDILLGDIFVLINAFAYGFYLVLVRPLMNQYSALQVIRWVFTIGMFIILPFGWKDFSHTDWSVFTPMHWVAMVFVVLGATFFAYLFNMYGVSAIGASATGSYIYTQPVFAAVISMVFLGERFTMAKALSAVLIFSGVYLANRASFKKTT